jgi:NAD(P) transhydrogenase subunit beta
VLFIAGIKRMSRIATARSGNTISAAGMLLAVVGTLLEGAIVDPRWIVAGLIIGAVAGALLATRIAMTEMPEAVALLNGLGGAASLLVAIGYTWFHVVEPGRAGAMTAVLGGSQAWTVAASALIGAVTLSGSLVAFIQLRGTFFGGKPQLLPARHAITAALLLGSLALGAVFAVATGTPGGAAAALIGLSATALALGVLLVIAIGGADMPVVVSLLNSYSGIAAAATGFVLANPCLIITGALVGASGLILTQIMCHAMNRSLGNVIFGGFGAAPPAAGGKDEGYKSVRSCSAEEAAMVLGASRSVVFVPGYGLAVSQAQLAVRDLADILEKKGARVVHAIHPVAGRMPGHMNVLLAEAKVPYEALVEMDAINPELEDTDVAIVIGANDVVNPAAETDPKSPIAGMPIIQAYRARTCFVIKRSLGAGYAGVKNELFERPNTTMIYGDAKKVVQELIHELKSA